MELPANDVWSWRVPFDDEALLEVVRGVVAVMPLERDHLIADAYRALNRLDGLADDDLYRLYGELPSVDAPEIDWDKAATLNVDAAKLEHALHHRSYWVVLLAANLLANRTTGFALKELATRTLGVASAGRCGRAPHLPRFLKSRQRLKLFARACKSHSSLDVNTRLKFCTSSNRC